MWFIFAYLAHKHKEQFKRNNEFAFMLDDNFFLFIFFSACGFFYLNDNSFGYFFLYKCSMNGSSDSVQSLLPKIKWNKKKNPKIESYILS